MCGNHGDGDGSGSRRPEAEALEASSASSADGRPFPWHAAPVYDAHCHPTDTVASLPSISAMRAAALTVMATRAQDQDLVAQLAVDQPVRVVPAFGWHPWFSYQLYDDGDGDGDRDKGHLTTMDDKRRHLAAVLTPSPPQLVAEHGTNAGADPAGAALAAALDALAASLPAIRPLSTFVATTRARLEAHPTALVGEVGLDKAFRVPEPPLEPEAEGDGTTTPGTRAGRRLSPFRVRPAHQAAVLTAQLRLAAQLRRPVSVHGVQAHGLLFATLAAACWTGRERRVPSRRERRERQQEAMLGSLDSEDDEEEAAAEGSSIDMVPAICLHSFSGPVDMLRQYLDPRIPVAIYVSLSTAVNAASDAVWRRSADVVAACPDDRLLVESDLDAAGPAMDAALCDMYRRVCAVKQWPLDEGVARIARNYEAFVQSGKKPSKEADEHV